MPLPQRTISEETGVNRRDKISSNHVLGVFHDGTHFALQYNTNMIHLFGDGKRRKIDLGWASKLARQAELLEAARGRCDERSEQNRKSAVQIQLWWRGVREAMQVKIGLRGAFERDVVGQDRFRCLVMIRGRDKEELGTWSSQMVKAAPL